jgi:hypothetical protein
VLMHACTLAKKEEDVQIQATSVSAQLVQLMALRALFAGKIAPIRHEAPGEGEGFSKARTYRTCWEDIT